MISTHPALSESNRGVQTLLCVLYLLLSLPFIFKPFHVDEPLYIWSAQQIVHHPLDFYGFRLNWEGHEQPFNQFFENPPLMSYLLAAASLFVGWNETGLRLALLPVNLLTLLGAWRLAKQFCSRPGLVVVLLLCCPAFFLSSTTLMCEPLSTCLWIWTVYFWIAGSKGRAADLTLAGLLAAGAILSKYSSLCLIPLLLGYGVIYPAPRRIRWMQIGSLLIPVMVTVVYEAYSAYRYGSGALTGAIGYISTAPAVLRASAVVRLLNTAAFVGGGLAGVALAALVLLPRRFLVMVTLLCSALAIIAAHFLLPPPGWGIDRSFSLSFAFYIQYAALFAGGIAVAVACGKSVITAWRHRQWRDELFLCLWIGGVFVFTAFFNWSINARSVLPMALPASVLIVRGLERLDPFPRLRLRMLIVLAGVLTLAVTNADYQLACACRSAAGDLVRIAVTTSRATPMSPPPQIWFTGHWGFQYYMQAAGARELDDQNPRFRVGEIAIFPLNSYGAAPGGHHFNPLGRYDSGSARWISTIQKNMGANFYCSFGYELPFVFGPIPPEGFTILQFTSKTSIYE